MKSSMRRLIIDRLIAEKGVVAFEELVKVLGVSEPTVKRDLRYMRVELGAPIMYSRIRGGYCYRDIGPSSEEDDGLEEIETKVKNRTIDPFKRTPDGEQKLRRKQWYSSDELYVLTSTYDLLGLLESDKSSALAKELAPLRSRVLGLFTLGGANPRQLMSRVKVVDDRVMYRESDAFELAGCAICEKRQLRIAYHAASTDEETVRDVSPLRLVHYRNRWYLDAYCHLTNALKTFLIENIISAEILSVAAMRLPLASIEAELDKGYGIFRGRAVQKAKLHFTQAAGRYVLREAWHPKQRVQQLDDGSLMLTVPYSDSTEIVGEILRWGSRVEVVGPEDLRVKVREEAVRIAAQYEADQKGDGDGRRD